jgi:succinyldiaminopimelate transaminase
LKQVFDRLPEYPWAALKPYIALAATHQDGAIDLSVGSPIDETPEVVQKALRDFSNAPGYPSTAGTLEFRQAVVDWFKRRRNVSHLNPAQVMPTIGSKEFISWLPVLLGLGPGDVVVQPKVAYTAYAVGAALAGAQLISDDDPEKWPRNTKLIWINSPGNPDGKVLGVEEFRKAVAKARELGALLASDECYAELGWVSPWDKEVIPSVLDERVSGASMDGILAVYSLSKQSNMAGYRAAFAVGSEELVAALVNLRMHSGMIMPLPTQQAVIAALGDSLHVEKEKQIYKKRREILLDGVRAYGFEVSDSEAGLYLWASLQEDCFETVKKMAELGIVVVPGSFYGEHSTHHVRFSLTATDDEIARASTRLKNAIG